MTAGDPVPATLKEYTLQTSNYYTYFIRTLNVKVLTTIKNAGFLKPDALVVVDVKGKGKRQITMRQYVNLVVAFQKAEFSKNKQYIGYLTSLQALYK